MQYVGGSVVSPPSTYYMYYMHYTVHHAAFGALETFSNYICLLFNNMTTYYIKMQLWPGVGWGKNSLPQRMLEAQRYMYCSVIVSYMYVYTQYMYM